MACAKDLNLDLNKLNVDGGAIALGHPLAASGSRITAHLVHELRYILLSIPYKFTHIFIDVFVLFSAGDERPESSVSVRLVLAAVKASL